MLKNGDAIEDLMFWETDEESARVRCVLGEMRMISSDHEGSEELENE